MGLSIIPVSDSAKAAWIKNFRDNFSGTGASLGFDSEEMEKVGAACDSIIFAIRLKQTAKAFSKACTAFNSAVCANKSGKDFAVPQFKPLEPPDGLMTANALVYLQRVVKQIKSRSNYSAALGVTLGIETASAAAVSPEQWKPKGKTKSLPNSVVRIDWTKGRAHGVIVQSQRGGETEWTKLDRDSNSPFIDTRPPLIGGQPEERRYRLRYFFNDEPAGDWSDIIIAITQP